MIDHYRVLEVDSRASREVIDKAYRVLSLRYHPDLQPAEERAAANLKMQQLNRSYAVLADPSRRREYDERRILRRTAETREAEQFRIFLDDGLIGLFRLWISDGRKS